MEKKIYILQIVLCLLLTGLASGAITVTSPTNGNLDQFATQSVQWDSDNIADGATVSIILCQNGSDLATLTSGQANSVGSNNYSWPITQPAGSNYSIKIVSETDPGVFDQGGTFSIIAPTISASSANINQFDNLNVSWSVTGAISNNATITVVENGQSVNITDGSNSCQFATDNSATWSPGTYTITAVSNDQGTISDSVNVTISASSISGVTAGNINQFDNLTATWTEAGTIGATVTVTATNGGFSQSDTIAAGTQTKTFATDNTWPAGTYTITVTADDHGVLTANNTCTVSASAISGVTAGNINQFDNLTATWTEAGTIGGTVTVTATNGGFSQSDTIAAGTQTKTFATDNTWPAGTYTITVTSDDHGALTANNTCTVSASSISGVTAGNINQFDNLTATWTEIGTIGATVTVTATNGGFSQSDTIAAGTQTKTFATDNTWPTGTYTITVTADDHSVLTNNNTCTLSASSISGVTAGNINQFDNLTATWTEAGTIGATVTVTATNGGFSQSDTIAAGTQTKTFATDNAWPTGTYTITVTSDDHGVLTANNTCTVSTSSISGVTAGNINQFDNLTATWTEAGTIGATVTVTATNGGFTQSDTIAAGTQTKTFATDNTWPAGTYTITVTSVDHPLANSSTTITVSPTALSLNAIGNLNQYDTLTLNWTETGSVGANTVVTVSNGGFSQIATVATGTLSTQFVTDHSWPAGNYTVQVKLADHITAVDSKSFTLTATSITLANPSNINQYDNISLSWVESGSVGATVDIVIKQGATTVASGQVPAGTQSYSVATDHTWSVGSYSATVTLTDHATQTDSKSFTLAITDISLNAAANIDQFDNISLAWSYSGSYGANVDIDIIRDSDSTTVYSTTLASSSTSTAIATDNSATWQAGNYTAVVTLTDHNVRTSSSTFNIAQMALLSATTSIDSSQANQLDTISLAWTGTSNVGNVSLQLYRAGSAIYTITANTANDGAHNWQIPLAVAVNNGYYLRVSSIAHPADVYFDAPLTFSVNETSITVGATSNINQFDSQVVTWSSTGSVGTTVKISAISVANGTVAQATSVNTASGSYTFSSDLSWPAANDYYIRIDSELHSQCYDLSSGNFTVSPTATSITSIPDIHQLDDQTISWNKTGSFGTNSIFELYRGGTLIDQQTLGSNTYTFSTDMAWTVGTYTVKIISANHPSCFTSDTFTLLPTVIQLAEPVESCYWSRGASQRIAWVMTGTAGPTLTINLYQNGALVTTATTSATSSNEEFFWTIPDSITAGTYNIKLISNQDNNLTSVFSANVIINDHSLGGYIYTDSSDPYGSGLAGATVDISQGNSSMSVLTNSIGYWSTPQLAEGDYTIAASMPRMYFEKAVNPDQGEDTTVYSLNTANRANSHSINFLSGYKVMFVSSGGSGSKSGLSWSNAADDLQAAIDLAGADPDDRYEEVWVKKGTYSGAISLADNCMLVGGFAGNENPATFNIIKRDLINNPSIISGSGSAGHVVDASDTNGTAVIDGFTITGGTGAIGAGLYLENANWTTVNNCTFYQNAASDNGGGVASLASKVILSSCSFQGNTAGSAGGAIFAANDAQVMVVNSTFSGNFAAWLGGAILAKNNSNLSIQSSTIASSYTYTGSAVELERNSWILLENSLLYYNANYYGQSTEVQYYYDNTCSSSVRSCYIQSPGSVAPGFLSIPDSGNGTWGDGDDNYGDLHLSSSSPCIDAGNNNIVSAYDRDGDLRVAGAKIDIGSDECHFKAAGFDSGDSITITLADNEDVELYQQTFLALENIAGGDNNTIEIMQIGENIHPDQDAYRVIGSTVIVETTLADGDYEMTLVVPFEYDDLAGANWNTIVLSYFDVGAGSWANAGTGASWIEQGTAPTMSVLRARALGDYGVYWNSNENKGFAWANVNHTTDFAPLIYTREYDFDRNGIVDQNDLAELLSYWLANDSEPYWDDRYDISEIKDGIINMNDFKRIAMHWLE